MCVCWSVWPCSTDKFIFTSIGKKCMFACENYSVVPILTQSDSNFFLLLPMTIQINVIDMCVWNKSWTQNLLLLQISKLHLYTQIRREKTIHQKCAWTYSNRPKYTKNHLSIPKYPKMLMQNLPFSWLHHKLPLGLGFA